MTNPKWLIGIATLFGVFTIISGLVEGTYLGPGEVSTLHRLIEIPWPPWELYGWFKSLWAILWFDYAFFEGSWKIFKYIIFWPISIGLIVSFGALLIQASIVAVRSLIPRLGL